MYYENFNHKLFANGLQGLSDQQVLETMLCNVISREEINTITKEVGTSFLDVISLDYDRLSYLNINHKAVCYLEYLREFTSRYLASSYVSSTNMVLDTSEKMCEYFERLFVGIDREEVHVIGLDDNLKLICNGVISIGEPNKVEISMRKMSEFVVLNRVSRIALAHNHPQGYSYPSDMDANSTKELIKFLTQIDVRVVDHIIIGLGGAFSLRTSVRHSRIWI